MSGRLVTGVLATAALDRHRTLVAEIERSGGDPAALMEPHRAAIDRIGVHEHHRRSWRLGSAPAAGRAARPAAVPAAGTGPMPGSAGVLWEGPWSLQDEEERR